MGLPREAASSQFSIRVSSQELERIFKARKNLDDIKALAQMAAQYQNMGWPPAALEADTGADLGVDFARPQAAWLKALMDLALKNVRVRLAVRLEPDSPLFVLRVRPAAAKTLLDRLGNWRSPCRARAGEAWEQHFFLLPTSWRLSPDRPAGGREAQLSVLGPGSVVTVPPATEPSSQEAWQWLNPPWEQPPWHPDPGLLLFLENAGFLSRQAQAAGTPETPPSLENLAEALDFLAEPVFEPEPDIVSEPAASQHVEGDAASRGWQGWLKLMPPRDPEGLKEMRGAVEEFLAANPDLAGPEAVRLLYYSYRNYIVIDPGTTGLTYTEKLRRAAELARTFLKSCP